MYLNFVDQRGQFRRRTAASRLMAEAIHDGGIVRYQFAYFDRRHVGKIAGDLFA
jgi:hypothetical protein